MKSNNIKKAVLVILCCIGSVTLSNAQDQKRERKEPPTYTQLLKDLDKNEDGKLSKAELKGPLKEDFDKIDTDKDGFISEKEFKKAPKPKDKGQRDRK